jgi:hypothetical protein
LSALTFSRERGDVLPYVSAFRSSYHSSLSAVSIEKLICRLHARARLSVSVTRALVGTDVGPVGRSRRDGEFFNADTVSEACLISCARARRPQRDPAGSRAH